MPDREGDVRERVRNALGDALRALTADVSVRPTTEDIVNQCADRILTALDTPQEPPEPVAWREERYWCGCIRTAHWDRCEMHEDYDHDEEPPRQRDVRHPPTDTPSATYTDEDGNERCHVGGCKLTLVESDDGTCYYRAEPPTDTGEDG